jgi:hypothetical protein
VSLNTCPLVDGGVPRLGITPFMYLGGFMCDAVWLRVGVVGGGVVVCVACAALRRYSCALVIRRPDFLSFVVCTCLLVCPLVPDETNTAVASACLSETQCATTFSSPAMLAASFNRSAWLAKGEVISTESRALHNVGGVRPFLNGPNPYKVGPNGYGPNINLMRDPRWGRNCEVGDQPPLG